MTDPLTSARDALTSKNALQHQQQRGVLIDNSGCWSLNAIVQLPIQHCIECPLLSGQKILSSDQAKSYFRGPQKYSDQKITIWRWSGEGMHWHDQRVHQSMEGRKVEHRDDPLHRRHHQSDEHRDHHCDQALVHYCRQRSMEAGGEKQAKKKRRKAESRTEKKQTAT